MRLYEKCPTVAGFKGYYKAWRNVENKYLSISMKQSKRELTRVTNLGKPTVDLPFMWKLSVDTHNAVETLLAMEKFSYLEGRFEDRRCPAASKLHYALSSIKDAFLEALEKT